MQIDCKWLTITHFNLPSTHWHACMRFAGSQELSSPPWVIEGSAACVKPAYQQPAGALGLTRRNLGLNTSSRGSGFTRPKPRRRSTAQRKYRLTSIGSLRLAAQAVDAEVCIEAMRLAEQLMGGELTR